VISGEGERRADGTVDDPISGLISGEAVSRMSGSRISVNADAVGRLLLIISRHTMLTYFGVAPRLMSTSGLIPSFIRFRMMSIYCSASSAVIPGSQIISTLLKRREDILLGRARLSSGGLLCNVN
jgi:hypothetical protein